MGDPILYDYILSEEVLNQVEETGIEARVFALEATGTTVNPGYRINFDEGAINQDRYFPIETVTGSSVTMQAGHAYKVYATTAAITLNTETIPANSYGLEGHLEIFVAGTGYVQTGSNVVLANALEPDSVNNCTVRFHDGLAIISVEDHVAGYIVVSATGTTSGTLPYGIDTATQEYVAFDATLNGATIDLSGSTANGEKHIVGNSYADTILTGTVDCGTSKFTVANLTLDDVQVTGGTLTFGDAFIPSGSTVSVSSGGGLSVEKVAGDGGVIDLVGTNINISGHVHVNMSGVQVSGGSASSYAGAMYFRGGATANLANCDFIGNEAGTGGGALVITGSNTNLILSGCHISGNNTPTTIGGIGGGILITNSASATLTGCDIIGNIASGGGGLNQTTDAVTTFSACTISRNTPNDVRLLGGVVNLSGSTVGVCQTVGGTMTFSGANTVELISGTSGTVTISSGAIVDLTGNTNSTPINPGGGITFASGGATVLIDSGGDGASSSYMMDNVTLPAGAKLTNTTTVDLAGSNVVISSGGTAYASGCTITGGSTTSNGGAFLVSKSELALVSCSLTGNTASLRGAGLAAMSATVNLTGCTIADNSGSNNDLYIAAQSIVNARDLVTGRIAVDYGGRVVIAGGNNSFTSILTLSSSITSRNGYVTVSSGAVIDLTGNTNATVIKPGGGITIYGGTEQNPTKILFSSGTSSGSRGFEIGEINGSTITNLGIVLGATVTNTSGDADVMYSFDNGATVSSYLISGSGTFEVPEGAGLLDVQSV